MKNKILLIVVLFLTGVLFIVLKYAKENDYGIPIPPEEGKPQIVVRLLNETDGSIEEKKLEDYIVGVVSAEMPASFETEALKAQAIAARTYALYKKETRKDLNYDLIIGTKDQAYQNNQTLLKKWGLNFFKNYLKIRDAVKETQNEVITYNGEIINAFYFSMSNGYTENVQSVFGGTLPYLESVESKWDNETINNYEYKKTISKEEFCQSLEIPCEEIIIENIKRNATNHVDEITINGITWKGTKLRTLLGLRSTDITINILENEIELITKGYGHGVGMSQYGANGMAKDGYTYEQILKYYYKNVEITKI